MNFIVYHSLTKSLRGVTILLFWFITMHHFYIYNSTGNFTEYILPLLVLGTSFTSTEFSINVVFFNIKLVSCCVLKTSCQIFWLSVFLYVSFSVRQSFCLSAYISVSLSVFLHSRLSACQTIRQSLCTWVYMFLLVILSVFFFQLIRSSWILYFVFLLEKRIM